ncbi:hypothetical protein AB1Y20_006909 [Prymnesium parvum]|uniref:Sfi1 spindle body domain-containing protein n=1 Tax=Prymnesium parvum TaxID=97485 RepID=A0AB34J1Q7_PRYPA
MHGSVELEVVDEINFSISLTSHLLIRERKGLRGQRKHVEDHLRGLLSAWRGGHVFWAFHRFHAHAPARAACVARGVARAAEKARCRRSLHSWRAGATRPRHLPSPKLADRLREHAPARRALSRWRTSAYRGTDAVRIHRLACRWQLRRLLHRFFGACAAAPCARTALALHAAVTQRRAFAALLSLRLHAEASRLAAHLARRSRRALARHSFRRLARAARRAARAGGGRAELARIGARHTQAAAWRGWRHGAARRRGEAALASRGAALRPRTVAPAWAAWRRWALLSAAAAAVGGPLARSVVSALYGRGGQPSPSADASVRVRCAAAGGVRLAVAHASRSAAGLASLHAAVRRWVAAAAHHRVAMMRLRAAFTLASAHAAAAWLRAWRRRSRERGACDRPRRGEAEAAWVTLALRRWRRGAAQQRRRSYARRGQPLRWQATSAVVHRWRALAHLRRWEAARAALASVAYSRRSRAAALWVWRAWAHRRSTRRLAREIRHLRAAAEGRLPARMGSSATVADALEECFGSGLEATRAALLVLRCTNRRLCGVILRAWRRVAAGLAEERKAEVFVCQVVCKPCIAPATPITSPQVNTRRHDSDQQHKAATRQTAHQSRQQHCTLLANPTTAARSPPPLPPSAHPPLLPSHAQRDVLTRWRRHARVRGAATRLASLAAAHLLRRGVRRWRASSSRLARERHLAARLTRAAVGRRGALRWHAAAIATRAAAIATRAARAAAGAAWRRAALLRLREAARRLAAARGMGAAARRASLAARLAEARRGAARAAAAAAASDARRAAAEAAAAARAMRGKAHALRCWRTHAALQGVLAPRVAACLLHKVTSRYRAHALALWHASATRRHHAEGAAAALAPRRSRRALATLRLAARRLAAAAAASAAAAARLAAARLRRGWRALRQAAGVASVAARVAAARVRRRVGGAVRSLLRHAVLRLMDARLRTHAAAAHRTAAALARGVRRLREARRRGAARAALRQAEARRRLRRATGAWARAHARLARALGGGVVARQHWQRAALRRGLARLLAAGGRGGGVRSSSRARLRRLAAAAAEAAMARWAAEAEASPLSSSSERSAAAGGGEMPLAGGSSTPLGAAAAAAAAASSPASPLTSTPAYPAAAAAPTASPTDCAFRATAEEEQSPPAGRPDSLPHGRAFAPPSDSPSARSSFSSAVPRSTPHSPRSPWCLSPAPHRAPSPPPLPSPKRCESPPRPASRADTPRHRFSGSLLRKLARSAESAAPRLAPRREAAGRGTTRASDPGYQAVVYTSLDSPLAAPRRAAPRAHLTGKWYDLPAAAEERRSRASSESTAAAHAGVPAHVLTSSTGKAPCVDTAMPPGRGVRPLDSGGAALFGHGWVDVLRDSAGDEVRRIIQQGHPPTSQLDLMYTSWQPQGVAVHADTSNETPPASTATSLDAGEQCSPPLDTQFVVWADNHVSQETPPMFDSAVAGNNCSFKPDGQPPDGFADQSERQSRARRALQWG